MFEIDAIDFHELDGEGLPLGSGERHLFAQPAAHVLPRWMKHLAMATPISVEVHEGELVERDGMMKIVVLESVARRRPVGIQLHGFLLGEICCHVLGL